MPRIIEKILKSVLFAATVSLVYFVLSWCIESMLYRTIHHSPLFYKQKVLLLKIGFILAFISLKHLSIIYFIGSLIGQIVNIIICMSPLHQSQPTMEGAAYELMITFAAIAIGIIVQVLVIHNRRRNI